MITFEKTTVEGFEHAIRAMRNPYDSWDKSDSYVGSVTGEGKQVHVGDKDRELCQRLILGGTEHSTFLRLIQVWVDITAPRMWWIEMDRYRVGKEQVSCSTMHTITKRPFTEEDFGLHVAGDTIDALNRYREAFYKANSETEKKVYWRYLIDNLPQSYNQKRTVMMSYQTVRKICRERKGHKLVEWADFIEWARDLPESWMVVE